MDWEERKEALGMFILYMTQKKRMFQGFEVFCHEISYATLVHMCLEP